MSSPRYLVQLPERTVGPHDLGTLQQMASVGIFDENVLIAPADTQAWVLLRDLPEVHAVLFPPSKKFRLKQKEFEVVNDRSAPDPAPSVEDLLRTNLNFQQPSEKPLSLDTIRPSQRKRDYLISAGVVNGLAAIAAVFLRGNSAVELVLLSFVVMANISIYWIFYHLMDRY
jgi:hypothetical protein